MVETFLWEACHYFFRVPTSTHGHNSCLWPARPANTDAIRGLTLAEGLCRKTLCGILRRGSLYT